MSEPSEGMPHPNDFSDDAVKKAVRNEALTHPLTLYPGVLAVLGGLGSALFASPALALAAMGMGLVGAGSLVVNYFFRDSAIARAYTASLKEKVQEHDRARLLAIKEALVEGGRTPGGEEHAAQAVEQFDRIQEKYRQLEEVLAENPGDAEIMGGVWFAGEQVFLSVLDNLNAVGDALKSAASIDLAYIRERLSRLDGLRVKEDADKREVETLKKRIQVRKKILTRVNDLLTQNEEALTRIDEIIAEIAAKDDVENRLAQVGLAASMDRLKSLAQELAERKKGHQA
jgi:hypothetical protein